MKLPGFLKQIAFFLLRFRVTRLGVGRLFSYLEPFLPLEHLRETKTLVAFYHPRPVYPVHIVIVPKKAIPGIQDLSVGDADFLQDLFTTVQSLVRELNLEPTGYRLVVNGGRYQDFPQLHFHLIAEET
jgi:histidine triad (HIT) family protein